MQGIFMDIIKQINREIHFRSAVPFLRLPRFQLTYTYSVRFDAPNCLIILFHVVTEDGTREHKLPNLFLCVSALVRHTIYWSVFHTHTHNMCWNIVWYHSSAAYAWCVSCIVNCVNLRFHALSHYFATVWHNNNKKHRTAITKRFS